MQLLADVASKGGNYLLNVGPTAEGIIPVESVERLREIGKWMNMNGEAIYGTSASPFPTLAWGRCTQKQIKNGTRLYLHVFDWPSNGKLVVPGIYSTLSKAYLLSNKKKTALKVERKDDALIISVGKKTPDQFNSIVVLDVAGKADVNNPPSFVSEANVFINTIDVTVKSDRENIEIRYTIDGSEPVMESPVADKPIILSQTATISAKCFRNGKPVSGTSQMTFTKVNPEPSVNLDSAQSGIRFKYVEGNWESLPNFDSLNAIAAGVLPNFSLKPSKISNGYGFEYTGYVKIPVEGIYSFYTASDDGSRLYIGDTLLVDNDGQHGIVEKEGRIALAAGYHPLRVTFFESAGGEDLKVYYKGPGIKKQQVPDGLLFYGK